MAAISSRTGGLVTLVIGAGASWEEPTLIPLAGVCSEDAYRRLIADRVLPDGRCENPWDLSAVADAVFEDTGGQLALVERLPREDFRLAPPNEGYLIAAALLREGALASLLSLNFDRVIQSALVDVGAREDVTVVVGPEDGAAFGPHNVAYLHRTVDHPPEEWILRTETLESSWTDAWEEAVAQRLLTARFVVFVGLGSSAAVLTQTTKRLRRMLGDGVSVMQIDPAPYGASDFTAELGIPEGAYFRYGWCAFMRVLAERVLVEHVELIRKACVQITGPNAMTDTDRDGLLGQLMRLGLVALGRLRARWILSPSPYEPTSAVLPRYLAEVVLALALVRRAMAVEVNLCDDGVVEFWAGGELIDVWGIACSAGQTWGAAEARIEEHRPNWRRRHHEVRRAVVSGAAGLQPAGMSPPESIIGRVVDDHLVHGAGRLRLVPLEQISDEVSARDLFGRG